MNKVAHYLQQHLDGEVLTSPDVLRYFSTDESVFEIKPMLVVHPRTENDIRKAARFSWQLAERGRVIPITIKGKGTDQTGASLGNGIILSTPGHLNKIIELDPKSGVLASQAGALMGKLQQTIFTHGRFLPSLSSAAEYSTIGGVVANNESGPSSYKYGPIREFVRGLRVVLANGELIQTTRLSKRELNKKLGLASFEGEIYRSLDKLIEESISQIEALQKMSDRSNVGYAIADVKLKDGSFDLTPLFVGSQGTLGLISEVVVDTLPHSPQTDVSVAIFSGREQAWRAVGRINEMKDGPLSVDFVDGSLMKHAQKLNPNLVKSTLEKSVPDTALFIEVEQGGSRNAKKILKKINKIVDESNGDVIKVTKEKREAWLALRDSASLFLSHSSGNAKPVPIVQDAYVPTDNMAAFLSKAEALFGESGQKEYAFWGQAGNGNVHAAPLLDLSQVGDRQKLVRIIDKYYGLVVEAGGSVAGEFAEGRTQGSQAAKVLSPELVELMQRIKTIFDPFNMLNPGVKVNVDIDKLKPTIRNSYTLDHQHSHLPRS